jgi:PAS domain S-box-containing protein
VNVVSILTIGGESLLATSFMPHGTCYLWKPGLVGLHGVSNLIIALSYFSIPIVLIKIVGKRTDIPFDWLFSLFASFIVFCGIGHLIDIWTLWHPNYWFSGYIRAITAIVSLGTAIALIALFPKILQLPSPAQIEEKNRELEREIEERQRIEAELQKERQFLQALLENLSDGIVACNSEGMLTLFNRATQEFHGLPWEPIAADLWGQYYDLYHADGKIPLTREEIPLFRALQGESVRDVEMAIIPKNGTIRQVLVNGNSIITPEGEKLGAVVAMRDISERQAAIHERKAAEAAIAEREAFLSNIYNGVELSIFVVDVTEEGDFRYVSLNPAHQRLTGLREQDIQGKTPEEVFLPEAAAAVRAHYNDCLAAGATITYEECLPFWSDRTWWLTSLNPLRDENSRICRLIGTCLNITARKQMEAELRESERRFYGAFEYAAIGMALVAPDGRWLRVNRALCEIVGYCAEELLAINFQTITHPDDLESDLDLLRQLLAGELNTYQIEKRYIHKLGQIIWINLNVALVRDDRHEPLYCIAQIKNITERKQAEVALNASEERWQLLLVGTGDGIFDWNIVTGEAFLSPLLKSQLGYHDEDVENTYKGWERLVHPEDLGQTLAAVEAHFNGETPQYAVEYRLRCQDGHYKWILARGIAQRDEAGNPVRMVGSHQDISDRKAAELALRDSLTRYRLLAENSSDLIATQTLDGVYLYVSPACQRLLGYPPEALVGRSVFEYLHPEDAEALQRNQTTTGLFRTQSVESYRMRRQNGTYLWLETTYQISNHLKDRQTQLIVSISRDITERKQAEIAIVSLNQELEREVAERRSKLKAVNRLYRNAIDSVQEVIFRTDKTGRWTFLSPAWTEITGFSIEQSLHTYFFDFVYPRRDQQRVNILFRDLIEQRRESIRYEFRTPSQSGGFRWLQMFAKLHLDEDDGILGTYGTLNDVTERKQAEALLKARADELIKQQRQIELQNLQLQDAARLKSEFLATMSHELRTPMNAIMGFSQLLQTQQYGTLSDRQQDMIDRIFNNSRNLLEMLNEVLDFSKLEIGRIDTNPEPFDVGKFVRLAAEELRSLADKKNLSLSVNLNFTNAQIVSDRGCLRRILVNLISNAIKFTETGGITVEVGEVGTERMAIVVADTGIGIAAADLENIFEAFHQVDRTLTRKYSGTGLGLAITKSLVELLEGSISVKSEVNRGSTFRVEIPRTLRFS